MKAALAGEISYSNEAAGDFLLAVLHQTGYLVRKDMARALRLCKQAASKGYRQAQVALSIVMDESDFDTYFFQEAFEWFVSAEQCVVPEGLHNAATLLSLKSDEGRAGNLDTAIDLYKQASNLGYSPSQNNLGLLLTEKRDYAEAYSHMQSAASSGYSLAQFNLALMKINRLTPSCDPIEGLQLLEQLANNQFALAEHALGQFLKEGVVIARDEARALLLFEHAAAQGMALSQWAAIQIYLQGDILLQNHSMAFFWCNRLASNGHVDAQFLLATLFHFGTGTRRNEEQALFWYEVAAANGHRAAQDRLSEFEPLLRN